MLGTFLSLNVFFLSKYVVRRFWGCKSEIPEYGNEGGNTTNSANRFGKLSLGAGSQKSRVSYFGTIITELVEHIFEKLFGWRDIDHQVVLSL